MKNQLRFYAIAILIIHYACSNREDFKISTEDYLQLEQTRIEVATVADSLRVPWELAYHMDKIFITEIEGTVKQLDIKNGHVKQILKLDNVFQQRTTGLLGMAIQRNAGANPYVILNYTSKKGDKITSHLVRYRYENDSLLQPKILLEVKGNTAHNGTRLVVTDKNIIYWATGDAYDFPTAQDSTSLNGKILRLDLDGNIPLDNPIPNSYVYAWGFRNMQGLTLDSKGNIFTSEHGDAIEDEVNLIRPLKNYGWPLIEGMHDLEADKHLAARTDFTEPIKSWTPVIAPAGLAFYANNKIPEWNNSLVLATLKSQSLRILKLAQDHKSLVSEQVFFSNRYGRLRAVLVTPNGDIYLSTSNKDWNPQKGFPKTADDRILRLRAVNNTSATNLLKEDKVDHAKKLDGLTLYKNYCASCHKENGLGLPGSFPPLKGSKRVMDNNSLIPILIKGLDGKKPIDGVSYGSLMPSFSFLKDEELLELTNYISTAFGNGSLVGIEKIRENR